MADRVPLSRRAVDRIRPVVLAYERGELAASPANGLPKDTTPRPPIRAILLEDLENTGTVDAAVLQLVDEETEAFVVQQVSLLGAPTGGTFTLTFHFEDEEEEEQEEETDDIPWNATPAELQAALEALEAIGPGNVVVQGGRGPIEEDGEDLFPGTWFVLFTGDKFIGEDVEVELMTATDDLDGLSVVDVRLTEWRFSGAIETVRAGVPVGDPTPLRAGAVIWAEDLAGAGYCVKAVEFRDFEPGDI